MATGPTQTSTGALTLDRKTGVPTAVASYVQLDNRKDEGKNVLEIVLANLPVTITDTGTFGTVQILDLPEGILDIEESEANLTFTTTSTLSSTLNASAVINWSLGTTAATAGSAGASGNATSASLFGSKSNIIAPTFAIASATINVVNTATLGGQFAKGVLEYGPYSMALLVNGQVFVKTMTHGGYLYDYPTFQCDIAISTASKAATFTTGIATVALTTGGVVAVGATSGTNNSDGTYLATGLATSRLIGTGIKTGGTFTAAQTVDLTVSSVTTYTQGYGRVLVPFVNTDVMARAVVDGSATAADVFLNVVVPLDTDIDGDATVTVSGTVRISYKNILDK